MSNLSKLNLLNALIASKREETKSQDIKVANKAKGSLIGLYRAKNFLQKQVNLDQQRSNIFAKAA